MSLKTTRMADMTKTGDQMSRMWSNQNTHPLLEQSVSGAVVALQLAECWPSQPSVSFQNGIN